MSQPERTVAIPRIPAALVRLFARNEEAESMLGDLFEEFSLIVVRSGVLAARRWYWRQALKSIVHLFTAAFRTAPWSTSSAVFAGILFRMMIARFPERAIFWTIDRYQIYESHFQLYRFLASTGIDIAHLLSFLFVGCAAALLVKGREMAVTSTMAFYYGLLTIVAFVSILSKTGDDASLLHLAWYFADSLAIVTGGAIVHMSRPGKPAPRSIA
jgi:hypothetical protein